MKHYRKVELTIAWPPFMNKKPLKLPFLVEAWDAEDAENRAIAWAIRYHGVWREHITVNSNEKQEVPHAAKT